MPISRELKARWLERLESPDAKWAGGVLHNKETGGMCCLGHLADITDSWDNEDRDTVDGNPEDPDVPFHGLTSHEIQTLVVKNDYRREFPLEEIRALPEEEAA